MILTAHANIYWREIGRINDWFARIGIHVLMVPRETENCIRLDGYERVLEEQMKA